MIILLAQFSMLGYNYFFGESLVLETIEPMPAELIVKAPKSGKNRYIKVETDSLTFWIDKKGGRIAKALISGADEPFFNSNTEGYLDAQTGFSGDAELNFTAAQSQYRLNGQKLTVILQSTERQGFLYKKSFEFNKASYAVAITSSVENLSSSESTVNHYAVIGGDKVVNLEQEGSSFLVRNFPSLFSTSVKKPSMSGVSFDSDEGKKLMMKGYSGVSFTSAKKPYVRMKFANMKKATPLKTKGGWLAFEKHHYIAAWVFDSGKTYRIHNYWRDGLSLLGKNKYEQQFATQASSPVIKLSPGESVSEQVTLYVGEHSLPLITEVSPTLRLSMDYGFFWIVGNTLHKGLFFFRQFTPSYTWSLILMLLCIRGVMFHFTKGQTAYMKRVKAMEPEKALLEKRFKDDRWNPEKFEEMSKLYKKHGIQGPDLSVFVQLLSLPLMLAFLSLAQVAVEFKFESFLWVPDMAQPDPYYILPLLSSLAVFLHVSSQKEVDVGEDFKLMFRFLPLVTLWIYYKWSAVMCLYTMMSTLLFVLQDRWMRRR